MLSPRNTPPKFIHVTTVTVFLEHAKWSRRLRSGELHIGPHRHTLVSDHGGLCQKFQNATVELTPVTRITLHYKTSLWPLPKRLQLDTGDLFSHLSASQAEDFESSVSQDGIRVVFGCRTADTVHSMPQNTENVSHTARTDETLTPTTDAIFEDHPQFRVLVIGKSGVGKSSLVHAAFGINDAHSADFERGEANIEEGLQSVANKRLILHDSLGFEATENVNYNTVKEFIRRRQTCAPKDRLHAVWFCVPVPQAGESPFEAAAEDFFRTKEETMGTIPITVVYTKADKFMNDWLLKQAVSHQQFDDDRLTELAFSEVKSHVEKKHEEVNQFAGKPLPCAVVSAKEEYKYTLRDLIKLTSDQVGTDDTLGIQIPAGAITLIAAQRVDPNLKIKGTIEVGRQKYWKALGSSTAFKGHSLIECLSVIHTDIVSVWNFNDPACHLSEKEFKDFIANAAEKMEIRPVSNPTQQIISLVTAVTAILGSATNPAAQIVLPVIAGLAIAVWLYGAYRSANSVQQLFMAYIVDLTHTLETLAILTSCNHKKLTRRIIKLAFRTYYDSGLMAQAHSNIRKYREPVGRDAALEMIKDLIEPERYGDSSLRNYYVEISKLELAKFNLDQEEEW